jgi:hypothetical protein
MKKHLMRGYPKLAAPKGTQTFLVSEREVLGVEGSWLLRTSNNHSKKKKKGGRVLQSSAAHLESGRQK